MFIKSRPNSRARARVCLMLVTALTVSLLAFPSAASRKLASSDSEEHAGAANATGQRNSADDLRESPASTEVRTNADYGKLDLTFEANRGQVDEEVRFLSRAAGYTVFLTAAEAVFVLRNSDCGLRNEGAARRSTSPGDPCAETNPQSKVLRMKVEGANPEAAVTGEEQLPGIVNYFRGSDPAKWQTDVPTFGRVRYAGVYEGVDMVYYGNQRQLEYDFVVAPGASHEQISLRFEGADAIEMDEATGDLLLRAGEGTLRQQKPIVYQEVDGLREEVESRYELLGGSRIGFALGEYDASRPLVIDPVLAYSTHLGGSGFDSGSGIALDPAGNSYVTGVTNSINFPTAGAFDNTLDGTRDAFVMKLNASGSSPVYITYLGGSSLDEGAGIAVDSAGNAYVTGITYSGNFPTANAIDSTPGGGSDAFVTKLNPDGSGLVYSTFLGGINLNSGEGGNDIALDSAGNAYVTGVTNSADFPLANAFDSTLGGSTDAFVARINVAGSALSYSTFLGGGDEEEGRGIVADLAGNAYVTGVTKSTNFPVANAFQGTNGGNDDVFVTKLNSSGSALAYSTYLGGSLDDDGTGIALDAAGNAYITGDTQSENFPVVNPIQILPDNDNAFVTKLNAAGSALAYSTYLGGSTLDEGLDIAVDSAGNAYVTGQTFSTNFPTVNAVQVTGAAGGLADAFVTKLNADGSAYALSTFLGGTNGSDTGHGIAVDAAGNAYVAGSTFSVDFPTTAEAFQPSKSGSVDAFIAKIGDYLIAGRVVDSGGNGIAGVAIALSGSKAAAVNTDASGNFLFLDTTADGSFTVTPSREGFTFSPASFGIGNLSTNVPSITFTGTAPTATPTPTPTATPTPTPATFGFSAASFAVDEEEGRFQVTVTRSGDTTQAQTVEYATVDGTANDRGDYTTAIGRLRFEPGDTSESFLVFITGDFHVEGNETVQIILSNPSTGAQLGSMPTTLLTIVDDDLVPSSANPIDATTFFVRQHYIDFLGRDPDGEGMAFWVENIRSCDNDAACREAKRTETSAAFFLSIEFQETGFLAHRAARAAFNRFPRFREFIRDNHVLGRDIVVGQPGWEARLEANKVAYFEEFITRAEFTSIYAGLTNAQYVDALNANTGDSLSAAERNALVSGLGGATETRATVLRKVVQDVDFAARERNPAFVLAQYFGYLRRNPDDAPDMNFEGYNFWLAKLNQFGGDFRRAEMVKAFLLSAEYRSRFGQP